MKPIVIIGVGGLSQEVAWIIDDINARDPQWDLLGFVDPVESGKKQHYGYPVLGDYSAVSGKPYFACGMGLPAIRQKESQRAEMLGWQAAALIHPSVIYAKFVSIGEGTTIAAGTVLGPNVKIGRHCILNSQVFVGHDVHLADFCVLAPGARVNGHAEVAACVSVGSNATVGPKVKMGAGATVAANSFLQSDLAAGESAIGVPAKVFYRSPEHQARHMSR